MYRYIDFFLTQIAMVRRENRFIFQMGFIYWRQHLSPLRILSIGSQRTRDDSTAMSKQD